MPASSPRTLRLRDVLRRFGANRKGSAAVQFALVAPLFFVLLFAIIEVAMVFFANQILETGTQDAARGIFTHQTQDSTSSLAEAEQKFQAKLCSGVAVLLGCSGVLFDVRSYPVGASFTVPPLFDAGGNAITANFTFQLPDPNSSNIVVVRTFYKWPLLFMNLGFSLANIGADKRLLTSTSAFRIEPSNAS
jgi:Flp pilus assembly protein TadG